MGAKFVEKFVIVDRVDGVIESPLFDTLAECHKWGMENLTHAYQRLAMIVAAREVRDAE
jgi:hypothetical protein